MPTDSPPARVPAGDPDTRWVAAERVVSSPVADELALLDQETDTYFTLNGTGARLWRLLQSPASARDLARSLAGEYAMPADAVLDDVQALLGELNENGLVRPLAAG